MLLTLDIGNTKTALGLFEGEELVQHWVVSTDPGKTPDEYAVLFSELFSMSQRRHDDVTGCIAASVVPALNRVLEQTCLSLFEQSLLLLDSRLKLGLENRFRHPEEVGADRLANAVGGKERFGSPLIIVDFGTATTIDYLSPDGDHAGGIILPGLEMSAEALYRRTAKLPRAAVARPSQTLGRTTIESLQSGLYFGFISAVDGLVERLQTDVGVSCPVVGTGGYAEMIKPDSRTLTAVDPHLIPYGLLKIWTLNRPT